MNTSIKKTIALVLPLTLLGLSCSKSNPDTNGPDNNATLKTEVLANIATNVCTASYEDMYAKALELQTSVAALITTPTDANLATARTKWRAMRTTWEQSEAWLFGPVDSESIDPRIDTWPVAFNDLDAILKSNTQLDEAYIDGLGEAQYALRGFHPIEFLLWGQNGTKKAADLKPRETEYLTSLMQNLVKLSKEARDRWTGGYKDQLAKAGNGSTEFTTQQLAFIQIADGMLGIAEEVGNAKIKEPFDAQDPTLEESPFAKNSITDFTNNIKGIMAIYQGNFIVDGKGIEDVVRANNLSLDAEIKSKHAAAISALLAIDKPFGEAITNEQPKVQNAMTKIGELADVIDKKLKPFLTQYTK